MAANRGPRCYDGWTGRTEVRGLAATADCRSGSVFTTARRAPRAPRTSNTVVVEGLIAKRIEATDGRISAKRLLPVAHKAGYTGSPEGGRAAHASAARNRTLRTDCGTASLT